MSLRRIGQNSVLITAAVLSQFVFAAVTHAGLTIDLRLPDGSKLLDPSHFGPGSKIPVNVYAVVTGNDVGVEGFKSAHGAFITTQTVPGSLRGRILPAGDLDQATFTTVLPAIDPYTAQAATRGASKDIPPPGQSTVDGVIDLGDVVNRSDLGDLVVFRAPSLQVNSGTVIPNGREFHIGRVDIEIQELNVGETTVNWYFRRTLSGGPAETAALFRVDGANALGTDDISSGAPIVIGIPEPATLALAALAAAIVRRRPRA